MARANILGVAIDRIDNSGMVENIAAWIDERRQGRSAYCRQICTVNPEFVMDARASAPFARVLEQADLCVADGVGILWAGRLLGTPFPERITGSDGIYLLCAEAARRGWRVFLLGAAPGVADIAANALVARYPSLQIAGVYSGSPDEAEWPIIRSQLATTVPDLLFVAYGHPRQDFWIHHHRHELPAGVALGIGGAIDFVAGITRRAPQSWQRLGLEWLYRLLQEPWRWRRMRKLPLFAALVAITKYYPGKQ